jgi:hypothetical protein
VLYPIELRAHTLEKNLPHQHGTRFTGAAVIEAKKKS